MAIRETVVLGRSEIGERLVLELGELETEILHVVKRKGKTSTREVVEELNKTRPLAYTTVITTLDRLHRKGFLTREDIIGRGGSRHVYSFADNRELRETTIRSALGKLVRAFGTSIVPAIYDELENVSKEEMAEIKKKVER